MIPIKWMFTVLGGQMLIAAIVLLYLLLSGCSSYYVTRCKTWCGGDHACCLSR